MTEKLILRLKGCLTRALVLAAAICCQACGSVFDDEGDCTYSYFVRFVFDMNMLRTDAFATQVNSVDLYVFDAETGEFLAHLSDKGEALASGNYRMPLTNIKPGKYEFVAWCGLADNGEDFTLRQDITRPESLVCAMARSRDDEGTAYSSRNLHALFHGSLSAELPDLEGEHVYTIKLIKDTNNINLSLNHTAGPLDPSRFEVTMTDDNGLMAYDNSLMADEQIEYRSWSLRSGMLDVTMSRTEGDVPDDAQQAGFLIAELSTARLMTTHACRINIVDKEEGRTVFSIPLVQWALALRSANHASMDDQEYLDREDEYNLMVFLADSDKGWSAMSIYINGWHIIVNSDVEF